MHVSPSQGRKREENSFISAYCASVCRYDACLCSRWGIFKIMDRTWASLECLAYGPKSSVFTKHLHFTEKTKTKKQLKSKMMWSTLGRQHWNAQDPLAKFYLNYPFLPQLFVIQIKPASCCTLNQPRATRRRRDAAFPVSRPLITPADSFLQIPPHRT